MKDGKISAKQQEILEYIKETILKNCFICIIFKIP